MEKNIFAPSSPSCKGPARQAEQPGQRPERKPAIPDYTVSPSGAIDHIFAFLVGFGAGAVVLFIFYKLILVSILAGSAVGAANIFAASRQAVEKRLKRLRLEFFDLLEAMSVSMRAGNPVLKALESARDDLALIHTERSDIIMEVDIIISRFNNAVPLSQSFADFAKRSGLEDIASFASIYATIEGKSSRADEIVRETQQIIADKMEIEMEIDTLMTAAKSEVNIMLFMPLVILLVIGYAGAGFMDAIYQPGLGRLVATGGLIVFIISFIMARKFSNVQI